MQRFIIDTGLELDRLNAVSGPRNPSFSVSLLTYNPDKFLFHAPGS
jgi:hypothetical protein